MATSTADTDWRRPPRPRLGFAMDQDMSSTSGQQLGFRSRGYAGVYLSGQESRVRRYHEVIDEYLAGKRPARGR